MTLTVQDLVTKLDDFADDAKVRFQMYPLSDESTYIVRNVASIEKNDKGDVVFSIAQIASIQHNDHEESEDEESEKE